VTSGGEGMIRWRGAGGASGSRENAGHDERAEDAGGASGSP
jgi:hypothetical protein